MRQFLTQSMPIFFLAFNFSSCNTEDDIALDSPNAKSLKSFEIKKDLIYYHINRFKDRLLEIFHWA